MCGKIVEENYKSVFTLINYGICGNACFSRTYLYSLLNRARWFNQVYDSLRVGAFEGKFARLTSERGGKQTQCFCDLVKEEGVTLGLTRWRESCMQVLYAQPPGSHCCKKDPGITVYNYVMSRHGSHPFSDIPPLSRI